MILIVLLSQPVIAQEQDKLAGFGIEANLVGGRILKHTKKIIGPVPGFSSAIDLNFLQQTHGKRDWEQRRHYPVWGVGLTFTDYGDDKIYGKCIGLYPVLQLPIIRGKKLEWTFRFGMGIGYVTRHYSRYPDYDTLNTAISSHLNNFTMFATDLRYHIDKHWDLALGANFSHISNAAFRQPNLGINMYGAHIGVRYSPATSRPEKTLRDLPKLRNRWLLQAHVGMAMNGAGDGDGPMYPVYLASVYASKRYAGKNKAFIGIDYSYHTRIYAFLKNNEIFPGQEQKGSWKSAIFIGNEWLMGRASLTAQVGFYLEQSYLKQDPYYEKFGYNYYLIRREKGGLKELFLSAQLKTHLTVAELAEFGLGIGL